MTSLLEETVKAEWEHCFRPFAAMNIHHTYGSLVRGVLQHHKAHGIRSFDRRVYNAYASYVTFRTPLQKGYLQTEWMVYDGTPFLCSITLEEEGKLQLLFQRDITACFSMEHDSIWGECIPWDVWDTPTVQEFYEQITNK